MFLPATIDRFEGPQARWFRRMVLLSMIFHGAVFALGSSVLVARIPAVRDPVVLVELMEPPPPDPPATPVAVEPVPAPPGPAVGTAGADAAPRRPRVASPAPRWLDKLDDPLAERPAAGARERARTPTLSARRPSGGSSTRPDDIAAAASSRSPRDDGKELDALDSRVRARRSPAVLGGEGIEAGATVDGAVDVAGEPIPPAVRDMIRRRVAGYLPELEAAYSAAFRLNPNLKGKLVIRIRIDARGNVTRAEPVETAIPEASFASVVLEKVRGWVFLPPAGFALEVIYPFMFVAPS